MIASGEMDVIIGGEKKRTMTRGTVALESRETSMQSGSTAAKGDIYHHFVISLTYFSDAASRVVECS